MEIRGLSSKKSWDYENGFYWFSPYNRIAKQIAHWELYKKILEVPGDIIEVGVFKGASLTRWGTFREISENSLSRKLIGFDAFGEFPTQLTDSKEDKQFVCDFNNESGNGLEIGEVKQIMDEKKFYNYELIKGDIIETIPKYIKNNPHTRIALLHLDVDIYKPTISALKNLWDKVSKGGLVIIDDYNAVKGATDAVDDFLREKKLDKKVQKTTFYSIPSYIIK